jgi:arsenate reductase (glutaredoxin)
MSLKLYGIPNCGTCKKAFQWLAQHNIEYEFINTKERSPSRKEIQNWIKAVGNKPLRNTSGQSYRNLGDEKQTWTDEQWLDAFANDAMLLKRPVFVKGGELVLVGFRDPEKTLQAKLGI